ncbi:hypothetical protein M3J09_001231 [Ascochyta lentis]
MEKGSHLHQDSKLQACMWFGSFLYTAVGSTTLPVAVATQAQTA